MFVFLRESWLILCFYIKTLVLSSTLQWEKLLMKRTADPEHTALYYQTSRDIKICELRPKSLDLFSFVCCCFLVLYFELRFKHFNDLQRSIEPFWYFSHFEKIHVKHLKNTCLWMHHTWNIWKTHMPFNVLVLFSRRSAALTRQIVLQMISFYTGGFLQTRNLFAVFHIQHVNAAWFGLLLHF